MPKATVVKLIVTGDDFGYCPRRNHGIVECFLAGAISNVSLLVNGSAVSDAVQLAKKPNSSREMFLMRCEAGINSTSGVVLRTDRPFTPSHGRTPTRPRSPRDQARICRGLGSLWDHLHAGSH
ncbi:hypothetical protein E2320_012646 [Naja naja]|nr:hypothetical protein E2320_012646 [Naja naja]